VSPADADGELLRRVPLFAGLDDEDLVPIAAATTRRRLVTGEILVTQGDAGDALFVVADGELQVFKRSGQADVPIATLGPGEIVGEMAVLEDRPRIASVRAVTPSQVLRIDRDAILEMVRTRPTATLSILRTVMGRLRSTEALLREREKLAALGTLSAGLAHELNNPAAAAGRSAALLRDGLDRWARATRALGEVVVDGERSAFVAELGAEIARRAQAPAALDPLDASDLAGELEGMLAERRVAAAADLAPELVAGGWDRAGLERMAAVFPGSDVGPVVAWVVAGSAMYALADELAVAARRISEIVRAVKEYAFMDQAPVQRVDIRVGLDNTLIILRPKLSAGIRVEREDDAELPKIEAYGSELNQVWTNLIDNAIDALDGRGRLAIRTQSREREVAVTICDDGPGIPAQVRDRIFEPFFTTKPPGSGTGLGLHISHDIVARHGGRIEVRSRPGETCFEVILPREHRPA
jgi:signal transduction histidine kinase